MDWKRIIGIGDGYPFSVGLVLVAAAVLVPIRSLFPQLTFMLLFVPVIVVIAALSGVRQSAVAAVLAFLLLDFLFVPPYYHLTVSTPSEWIGLLVFLIVALVAGQQTGTLRRREQAAVRRGSELELLNKLSFRLAAEKSPASTAEFVARELAQVLEAARTVVYTGRAEHGGMEPVKLAEGGPSGPGEHEGALAEWVLSTSKAIGMPALHDIPWEQRTISVGRAEAVPGVVADGVYMPLQTADSLEGVLVLVMRGSEPVGDEDARLLAAIANLAATSFRRQRLQEEASHAEVLREADRLRGTLVSSVSHELKTPLAAATARVTGLLEEGEELERGRTREELEAVADDLDRLNASIGGLLDLSRLESEAWRPRVETVELREVLGTVLSRLPANQRSRVRFELPEELPVLCVDFAQLVRALANVASNGLAYSAPSEEVVIGAEAQDGGIVIRVEDSGPGITDEEKERVFDKFYRGEASVAAPAGTGLGLAVAREIVRAQGGTMSVEDAEPKGARFVIRLPAGECEV